VFEKCDFGVVVVCLVFNVIGGGGGIMKLGFGGTEID